MLTIPLNDSPLTQGLIDYEMSCFCMCVCVCVCVCVRVCVCVVCLLMFFYNYGTMYCPTGIFPVRNSGRSGESQLRQSLAAHPMVYAGYFSVSIIHRILTWTTGSLTCVCDLCACLCAPRIFAASEGRWLGSLQSLHRIGLRGNSSTECSTRRSPIHVLTTPSRA